MLTREDLHTYQRRAAEFIETNERCALWVDMGLGKTVSTLTAVAELIESFEVRRVLVIAPKRVALHTWPAEFAKWDHLQGLTYAVADGTPTQRAETLRSEADVHIVGRDNVPWLVSEFRRGWRWDMVVIDESSSFKNHSTKRFKSLRKALPKIDRMVELTGTPSSNGLLDLWPQVFLLDQGERLGRTFSGFRDRYFSSDYMGYNWSPRPGAEECIYDALDDIVLTLSAEDYLDMPARIDESIPVELPKKAREQYAELERDFLLELDELGDVVAVNAAVLTGKLSQCANGATYYDDADGDRQTHTIHTAKIEALREIAESGEPVLVAYNFRSDLEALKHAFPHAHTVDEVGVLDAWNRGEVPMLLAHPASAGHGLNLQHGGRVLVWYGLTWSLELYQQFNARLHRQGQTRPVIVYHIVAADTVDERVLESLGEKNRTQAALLAALKSDIEGRLEWWVPGY